MTTDLDTARDLFRARVLDALDAAAQIVFRYECPALGAGASDADLAKIFPAIDAQLDRLVERYEQED